MIKLPMHWVSMLATGTLAASILSASPSPSLALAPAATQPTAAEGAIAALSRPTTQPDLAGTFTNPLGVDVADPHVIRSGGTYYLYGTSSQSGYKVWSSDDLVHWQERGQAFKRTRDSWGRRLFWAPCVVEKDAKFYMFYSSVGPIADGKTSHRISVAVADSPVGPFNDLRAPLLEIGKAVIDAHVLVDPERDGRNYLYFSLDCSENKISEVQVIELNDDLTATVGSPIPCIKPSQAWEGDTWNEAPFVFRAANGTYVMMYSGRGFFDPLYAVGFATAPAPAGPWTKARSGNPFLRRTDEVSGPGHNCVVASPDGSELFLVYHRHKSLKGGHARELAIDRLTVVPDDKLGVRVSTVGPTHTPQPMPSTNRVPAMSGR